MVSSTISRCRGAQAEYPGPQHGPCRAGGFAFAGISNHVFPSLDEVVTMVNSIYNDYRMEDVWLDK
jgi:hypothetical protein